MDEFTKKRINKIMVKYTNEAIPEQHKDKMKLSFKIRGNNVTLIEERPAFRSDQWVKRDIAQFRLDQDLWKIYWKDSKGKWHFVDDFVADEIFENQLAIVVNDERGMFWG